MECSGESRSARQAREGMHLRESASRCPNSAVKELLTRQSCNLSGLPLCPLNNVGHQLWQQHILPRGFQHASGVGETEGTLSCAHCRRYRPQNTCTSK